MAKRGGEIIKKGEIKEMKNLDYVDIYIDAVCNSENTKIAYMSDLNSMLEFVNKPIQDITSVDILKWKKSMANDSSATVARRLGTSKRFFFFLYANEYINTNPTKAIKLPRIANKEEDTLTRDELDALIKACKNSRDKAILSLMASTGIRVGELCNIMLGDIDSNNNIKILGKGNKWRIIHLNNKVADNINKYIKDRKKGCGNLFVSNHGTPMTENTINHTLKTLARRAGVGKNVHPHMLRHYTCTNWIENGVLVEQARLCLGHSNISTTLRYFEQRNKQSIVENVMNIDMV